jgi:hypothetical protein
MNKPTKSNIHWQIPLVCLGTVIIARLVYIKAPFETSIFLILVFFGFIISVFVALILLDDVVRQIRSYRSRPFAFVGVVLTLIITIPYLISIAAAGMEQEPARESAAAYVDENWESQITNELKEFEFPSNVFKISQRPDVLGQEHKKILFIQGDPKSGWTVSKYHYYLPVSTRAHSVSKADFLLYISEGEWKLSGFNEVEETIVLGAARYVEHKFVPVWEVAQWPSAMVIDKASAKTYIISNELSETGLMGLLDIDLNSNNAYGWFLPEQTLIDFFRSSN